MPPNLRALFCKLSPCVTSLLTFTLYSSPPADAVRQNSFCKDAMDEEIERYMKRWLQLAGDRDGGRKRREKCKEAHSMQDYCVDDMFTHVME